LEKFYETLVDHLKSVGSPILDSTGLGVSWCDAFKIAS